MLKKISVTAALFALALSCAGCVSDSSGSPSLGASVATAINAVPAATQVVEVGATAVASLATISGAVLPIPAKTTANIANAATKTAAAAAVVQTTVPTIAAAVSPAK